MFRWAIILFSGVAALTCAAAAVWLGVQNLRILQTWKHVPAIVTGTADPRLVEVSIGPLEDAARIEVPVRPGSMYSNWEHVTVLENGTHRLLSGLMDLWQPALATALAALLMLASVLLATRRIPPAEAVWSDGRWTEVNAVPPAGSPIAEVRPPGEAWKANLLWAAILGGSLLAVALLGSERNLIFRVLTGWAGTSFVVWMLWSSVESYTRVLIADGSGLQATSWWSRRRVGWEQVATVKLVNVKKELEKLKGLGAQGKMKPVDHSVPEIRHWVFYDANERELFRVDVESQPASPVHALVEEARRRCREARRAAH